MVWLEAVRRARYLAGPTLGKGEEVLAGLQFWREVELFAFDQTAVKERFTLDALSWTSHGVFGDA